MEIYVKIEMNEIIFCKGLSHYNYLVWKLNRRNNFGVTHVVEKYDDVSREPDYALGTYEGNVFKAKAHGYGGSIYESNLGVGGIYVDICIL
jgi:hypothetical protein